MTKIVVGPINRGLRKDVTAFNINNDNFPTLFNAYQWRGRLLRKRGTSPLVRLTRNLTSQALTAAPGAGANYSNNIKTTLSLESNASMVPNTLTVTFSGGLLTLEDDGDGTLTQTAGAATLDASSSINYSTMVLTIVLSAGAFAGNTVSATFDYYPGLPVLGLETFIRSSNAFPGTLAFDTKYAYSISTDVSYSVHNVNFYKNPATATYTNYVQKTTDTALLWNGQDYQQFWSVNYQGAFWVTNGVNIPFTGSTIGMQFKSITNVAGIVAGPPATANLTITGHGLVIGDFVFINEIPTATVTGINFQTGYVTTVVSPDVVTVTFPNATLAGGGAVATGIAQYLTSNSNSAKDCIRWYDGDPTTSNNGFVNFCPPLSQSSAIVSDLPTDQYYLVSARIILPFKDRLLFIGPVVQTSTSSPIYLKDTVVYSLDGTPYYTASFTGDVGLSTTTFNPILVPSNQTGFPPAYFTDSAGFGGFIQAGVDAAITTANLNEDVVIMGFEDRQTRFVYTGNDITPFNFYIIDTEYPSDSTFSVINMGKNVLTTGRRGIVLTNQTKCDRVDMQIPDEVFQFRLANNGIERITAQRDYINEWIYISYPNNNQNDKYNGQTLLYNYRDNSWAIFSENYTTYGQFQTTSGYTWANIGIRFPTWNAWNQPWNAGSSTLSQPVVIAGNQQGFVVIRDDGTDEAQSLFVQGISSGTVTSPNHGLLNGDYITFSDVLGAVGTQVNNKIFSIRYLTVDTFSLNPVITSATYSGGGTIKRIYKPLIQSKQFPVAWQDARKTRIGVQQYLITRTDNSQITLEIYLSQNDNDPYNNSPIVPSTSSFNDTLIYSNILYTCPESTNLGLTAANVNLQMPTGSQQQQIWHRVNTSLIGDTVQVGFTLSDEQMRNADFEYQFSEIEIHGFILDVNPSQMLA